MGPGRRLLLEEGPHLPSSVQAGLAVAVVAVVAIAGIMSGLTLGLLSMDRLDLEVMMRTGNKKEQKFARRLYPLVLQPHWVLATLVICNTAAGMALPLTLDRLVNWAVALVLSTTAIVIFGEILPQAVCSRHGLSIGGHAAPAVRVLMWLSAPVSWPIAKSLDWLLGAEQPLFGKRQISALVDLHRESAGMGGPLTEEEAHVIAGALELREKTGEAAMTPLDKVFMLSTDERLDRPTLKRILDSGHSRVPVYRANNRSNIIGLILVKELLAVVGLAEPGAAPVPVSALRTRDLPVLPMETPMTDLLNLFQTGHSHMALLLRRPQAEGAAGDAPKAGAAAANGEAWHAASGAAAANGSQGGAAAGDRCWKCHQCAADEGIGAEGRTGSGRTRSTCVSCGGALANSSAPKQGVAGLLRQISNRTLHRIESIGGSSHKHSGTPQPSAGGAGRNAAASAAVAAADAMEAGMLPAASAAPSAAGGDGAQLQQLSSMQARHQTQQELTEAQEAARQSGAAASGVAGRAGAAGAHGSTLQHRGTSSSGGTAQQQPHPQAPRRSTGGAAAVATAVAAVAAGAVGAGALGRPSAATVWKEAGWDAESGVPVGVITLEDVLEELMQEEIVDETDAYIDNEKTCRVNARVLAGSLPPGLRRLLIASQQHQQQRLQAYVAAAGNSAGGAGSGSAAGAAAAVQPSAHGSSAATPAAAAAAAGGAPGSQGPAPLDTMGSGGGGLRGRISGSGGWLSLLTGAAAAGADAGSTAQPARGSSNSGAAAAAGSAHAKGS